MFAIAFVPDGHRHPDAAVGRRAAALGAADQGQTAPTTTVAGSAPARRRSARPRAAPPTTAGVAGTVGRHDRRRPRPPPPPTTTRLIRAVVLVGGFGTRLRPLTNSIPKPMLPIGHVPMIVAPRRPPRRGRRDRRRRWRSASSPNRSSRRSRTAAAVRCALDYAVEPEPLDTAGAIRFAAEHAGIDDTFVVANGDILTDLDVGALVAAHRAHGRRGDDPPHPGRRSVGRSGSSSPTATVGCVRFVEKPPPGTEPSEPDQRRHLRVRAVACSTASRPAGRCRSSGHVPAISSPTAGCTRWPPTTTGSTPVVPSCTCTPTSTSSTVAGRADVDRDRAGATVDAVGASSSTASIGAGAAVVAGGASSPLGGPARRHVGHGRHGRASRSCSAASGPGARGRVAP